MIQKKTKIVCTISDQRCDVDFIRDLYDRGLNVVRMNTAHLTDDGVRHLVSNVRAVSEQIPILIDTKGPEIRTTVFVEGCTDRFLVFEPGDRVEMVGDPTGVTTHQRISMNYPDFVTDVPVGSTVLIDDGEIAFTIVDKCDNVLIAEATNHGELGQRKSVNVPGVSINLPSLTEKDRHNLELACSENIDFVAHSFVRSKQDVLDVQAVLDAHHSDMKIIAKIENQEGVDNIDEILDVAYGVMVARGDLGIEVAQEKIPGIQRMLIRKCMQRHKPVIVATQMLHTMIKNPRPTRAEISDIANAVFAHTDAVMLSGETAYGAYPREAVQTMAEVCRQAEAELDSQPYVVPAAINHDSTDSNTYLCKHASIACESLNIHYLVTTSSSGMTARTLAAFRPHVPIFTICNNMATARRISLSYDVNPCFIDDPNMEGIAYQSKGLRKLLDQGRIQPEDMVACLIGQTGKGAYSLALNSVSYLTR